LIREDPLSRLFTFTAGLIVIYLATFEQGFVAIFPGFLLLMGLVIGRYLKLKYEVDPSLSDEESTSILLYTLIALLGMVIASLIAGFDIFLHRSTISLKGVMLSGVPLMPLHALLMAVAEEQFFRGAVLEWIIQKTGQAIIVIPSIISGIIGAAYHMAVYHTKPDALIYVFIAWIILSYVAIKTRRLSPTMLAHVINNFMATMGVGG